MTVKSLIEQLRDFPEDWQVVNDGGFNFIYTIGRKDENVVAILSKEDFELDIELIAIMNDAFNGEDSYYKKYSFEEKIQKIKDLGYDYNDWYKFANEFRSNMDSYDAKDATEENIELAFKIAKAMEE